VNQLQNMGWPRTKGFLKKTDYVDSQLVDITFEQGLHICCGLGAGRPEMAGSVIADIFNANPWTPASTKELLTMLATGDQEVRANKDELPWKALYRDQSRLAGYSREVPWEWLGSLEVALIRAILSAKAAYWGLTHPLDFVHAFELHKGSYEETAKEMVPHGLEVPLAFPWGTLEDFFATCESMVTDFQKERPPLTPMPPSLRNSEPFRKATEAA
jgi:hypothetical protein